MKRPSEVKVKSGHRSCFPTNEPKKSSAIVDFIRKMNCGPGHFDSVSLESQLDVILSPLFPNGGETKTWKICRTSQIPFTISLLKCIT